MSDVQSISRFDVEIEALTIARRTSIVVASAFAFALMMLLASESAAAVTGKSLSVFLASPDPIKRQVDAAERRRVLHNLAALQFGPVASIISPAELDTRLGPTLRETPASPENHLDEVEVETRAPPGVQEQPLESQIPFGLAAIAWGFRHPSEAWRLFLPVMSGTAHAQAGAYAATPGRHRADPANTAVKLP